MTKYVGYIIVYCAMICLPHLIDGVIVGQIDGKKNIKSSIAMANCTRYKWLCGQRLVWYCIYLDSAQRMTIIVI